MIRIHVINKSSPSAVSRFVLEEGPGVRDAPGVACTGTGTCTGTRRGAPLAGGAAADWEGISASGGYMHVLTGTGSELHMQQDLQVAASLSSRGYAGAVRARGQEQQHGRSSRSTTATAAASIISSSSSRAAAEGTLGSGTLGRPFTENEKDVLRLAFLGAI